MMTKTTAQSAASLVVLSMALVGCGRFGYDSTAVVDDAAADDDAPDDAASPVADASVAEHVQLLPDWTVDVWRDFSDQIEYDAQDLIDGDETYDNAPSVLVLLSPPFEDGFGVLFGRGLLQIPVEGPSIVHDYRAENINGDVLPDHMADGLQVPSWRDTGESILIASTSDLGGDGVYQIATDWSMSRAQDFNNVRSVAFDPIGSFDDVGNGEVYFGAKNGLKRYAEPTPASIEDGDTVRIAFQPGNRLLIVRRIPDVGTITVSSIASGTHNEDLWFNATSSHMRIVRGTVAQMGATFIRDRKELVEFSQSEPERVIASSTDPDWRWMSAVKVSTGPLAFDGFYLLEHNPVLDLERILKLGAP